MLQAVEEIGLTAQRLQTFLRAGWVYPHHMASKCMGLDHVLDTCRAPEQDKLKCNVSEPG